MKTFVIFQGGSGSKATVAFSHLVSIGMIDNEKDEIIIRVCDKDSKNMDTVLANDLVGFVTKLTDTKALKPAVGNGFFEEKVCFKNVVSQAGFDFTDALEQVIKKNEQGVDADLPLSEWLNSGTAVDKCLLNAFFTKEQQEEKIGVGFKGSASRGALIYSYLLENDQSIVDMIQNFIKTSTEHCKVFIVGSIFGGTGASMFLKTAEVVKNIAPDRIHVAGALMLPFFTFEPSDDCSIDPKKFWPKTITSLKGYADYPNLVKTHCDDKEGLLDRLYLAVQPNQELHYSTLKASEGGADQQRKSNFVDLVTADYIVDFINAAPIGESSSFALGTPNDNCSNIYTFDYPAVSPSQPLKLNCIPGLSEKMTHMLKFSAAVFRMIWLMRAERNLHNVVWLNHLFGRSMLRNDSTTIAAAAKKILDPIFDYCCEFVDFVMDLSKNGESVIPGGADFSDNYEFFNNVSINALWNVKNSLCNGNTICSSKDIMNVLSCKSYCEYTFKNTAEDALQEIGTRARNADMHRANVPPEEAIKAFVNCIYDYLKQ